MCHHFLLLLYILQRHRRWWNTWRTCGLVLFHLHSLNYWKVAKDGVTDNLLTESWFNMAVRMRTFHLWCNDAFSVKILMLHDAFQVTFQCVVTFTTVINIMIQSVISSVPLSTWGLIYQKPTHQHYPLMTSVSLTDRYLQFTLLTH